MIGSTACCECEMNFDFVQSIATFCQALLNLFPRDCNLFLNRPCSINLSWFLDQNYLGSLIDNSNVQKFSPPTPTPNNNNNKIKLKNIIISPQNSIVASYLSYLDYPWIAVLFSTMYCICCDEDPQKFFRGQLLDTPV